MITYVHFCAELGKHYIYRNKKCFEKMKRAFDVQRAYKYRGFRDKYAKGLYEYVFELVCSTSVFPNTRRFPSLDDYHLLGNDTVWLL
jgi:hypothetical protein